MVINIKLNFIETNYIHNDVFEIRLNRPELRNAFNDEIIKELTDLGNLLLSETDIRVVILTGNGKSFCAGADLNWMRKSKHYTVEENIIDAKKLGSMFHTLNNIPQALIGKINGSAIGGGTGLVSVCDVTVGTVNSKFAFSEVNLGLLPAVISPFVIERIGLNHARELFLTGERFNGTKAEKIGLLNYVVSNESELDEIVTNLIYQLRRSGPNAIKEAKKLLKIISQQNSNELLKVTSKIIADIRTSKEGQEGISSFLEKRDPNWIK